MKQKLLSLIFMLLFGLAQVEVACSDNGANTGDDLTECGKIIASCIAAASLYGVAQTQIMLAHCHPYYTTDSAKNVLRYGVEESWWRGAFIGVPVALACRFGSWPKLSCGDIVKPMVCTMGLTAATAAVRGAWEHDRMKNTLKKYDSNDVEVLCFGLINGDVIKSGVSKFTAHVESLKTSCLAGPLWSIGLIAYILRTRYNMSLEPLGGDVGPVS